MLDRLNPHRVLGGVFAGLRRRSRTGNESADVGARLVLFGVPLIVAATLSCGREPLSTSLRSFLLLLRYLLARFWRVSRR